MFVELMHNNTLTRVVVLIHTNYVRYDSIIINRLLFRCIAIDKIEGYTYAHAYALTHIQSIHVIICCTLQVVPMRCVRDERLYSQIHLNARRILSNSFLMWGALKSFSVVAQHGCYLESHFHSFVPFYY